MNHSPTAGSFRTSSSLITGKFWLKYLRVPYKKYGRDLRGWDCFGVVRYLLIEHKGIELPMFDMISPAEILRQSRKDVWIKQVTPQAFDVVSMAVPTKFGARAVHVGIMVEEDRLMHCQEGLGTVCVPLNHVTVEDRIEMIYRHRLCA